MIEKRYRQVTFKDGTTGRIADMPGKMEITVSGSPAVNETEYTDDTYKKRKVSKDGK